MKRKLFCYTLSLCLFAALLTSCAVNVAVPAATAPTPTLKSTVSEPVYTEPPVETKTLSFLAAGDNVIHKSIYMDAKNRAVAGGREYNFKPMYQYVSDFIASYDLSFINQETLMAGESFGYSNYPLFNTPQDLGYDLIDIGFDIVNIANNHMLDKGESGLKSTIEFWKAQSVTMIGGYDNDEDFRNIRVVEKNGIKIAMLSFTYGCNGNTLPAASELRIPYINDEDILSSVSAAKGVSDVVIVSIHWGVENTFTPTDEQKRLAKLMSDAGVDVILGHHPHVLQPVEWIEGEGGKTLCIYSLGNLLAAMAEDYNMVGGFLTFDIELSADGVAIKNPLLTPTVFYFGPSYFNSMLYFMKDYAPPATHGIQVYGNYTTDEKLRGYVTKTVSPEFLPDYMK